MKPSILILICVLSVACKKRPVTYPPNELHYKETQCSDAWRALQITDTKQAVKEWLQHQGVTLSYVKIIPAPKGMIACEACHCPTGRVIRVLFDAVDIAKAKSLGFYKP